MLDFLLGRCRDRAVPDRLFSRELAHPAHGVGLPSGSFLGRLLVKPASAHFPEQTLSLHLLLQHAQRHVYVIVADEYLHDSILAFGLRSGVDACRAGYRASLIISILGDGLGDFPPISSSERQASRNDDAMVKRRDHSPPIMSTGARS